LLAAAACAPAAGERPRLAKPGKPAPQLRLPKLINAPLAEIKNWDDLKGKAVVLDFWATWCENCVDSIAHLNDLADQFSADPVVFIAVTDETEGDVTAFLKNHPMKGWVAPEAGAEIFRAFRVYGRPYSVLVAKDGRVAEITTPGALAPENIRNLLSGKIAPGGAAANPAAEEAVLAEFYIAESAASGGGNVKSSPSRLQASSMPLKYAFDFAFGAVDRFEIKPEAARIMDASYDMRLRFPKGRGDQLKREFFLKGLETALGLKVRDVSREVEVYILKTAPGGPVNVKKKQSPGDVRFEGQTCVVDGGSFSVLGEALRSRLDEIVLDETGVKGNYAYAFDFKDGDKKALNARLGSQLGLRLERRLRKIRILEISRPAP